MAGAAAHRYKKEPVCEECRAGGAAEERVQRNNKTMTAPWRQPYTMERACDERSPKFPAGKRGTTAGFNTHKRAGDEPCPECLEARREYGRKSTKKDYDKHKDKKLAYQAKYREENRERIRERDREYHKANPEKGREASRRKDQKRKEQRLQNSPWRWPWVNERTCDQRSKSSPDGKRGTLEGYKLHLNNDDPPCQECVSAFVTSIAEKPWMQPYTASMACEIRYSYAPHGSTGWLSGYDAHVEAGEEPCEMCLARKEKEREKWKEKNRRKRAKKKDDPKYRERRRAARKKWRERNPEARAQERRKRDALKRNLPHENYSEDQITQRYGSVCYLCAKPIDMSLPRTERHIEHLIPLYHPTCPGDILANVRWAHPMCNATKSGLLLHELSELFPDMIDPYSLDERSRNGTRRPQKGRWTLQKEGLPEIPRRTRKPRYSTNARRGRLGPTARSSRRD